MWFSPFVYSYIGWGGVESVIIAVSEMLLKSTEVLYAHANSNQHATLTCEGDHLFLVLESQSSLSWRALKWAVNVWNILIQPWPRFLPPPWPSAVNKCSQWKAPIEVPMGCSTKGVNDLRFHKYSPAEATRQHKGVSYTTGFHGSQKVVRSLVFPLW